MSLIVYFNGRFVPKEDVRISPDDRGFLFADGAYEVLRSYGGRLFRAEEHFRRMDRSLRELRIAGPDEESLRHIAGEVIRRNTLGDADAALYVQITRGVALRRHAFPDEGTPPTVYVSVSPFRPSRDRWESGVKVILVPDIRWVRCDIKSVALLPNVLASQRAKESNAEEAVFVRDGVVTEGSHTNFCAVFDGRLVTHPRTNHILAGITRGVVRDLCGALDIPFRESPIREKELRKASELMILGTTTEIMPVVQVDNWRVGDGKPGPVTTKLQQAFRDLVTA
jgi:D-alanine transaminase